MRDHLDTMSTAERERFLAMLDADAERLERLVRRLLDLARADVIRPGDERADLRAVTDTAAARFRELGLAVAVASSPGLLKVAMAAETLDSILGTLLDNARQHAGAGATVTIACGIEADGRRASLEVSDNGAGISAGNAHRIFEPFFTTARERGGTGLGLAIIRALLVAHGGDIALVPAVRGAAFRLTLPLAEESDRNP